MWPDGIAASAGGEAKNTVSRPRRDDVEGRARRPGQEIPDMVVFQLRTGSETGRDRNDEAPEFGKGTFGPMPPSGAGPADEAKRVNGKEIHHRLPGSG